MKKLSIILLLALLIINIQCGGGGDRTHSGTTPVSIKVTAVTGETGSGAVGLSGAVKTGDLASAVADGDGEGRQLSMCRITITGPGMADMVREVDIAGKSSIRETFNVPSGLNRSFLIQMFIENNDTVIVQAKSDGNNLEGKYMEILMKPTRQDDYFEAPEFSGILSVSNAETRSVMLHWKPATDNITDQKRIQYLIYLTTQFKRDQHTDDVFKAYERGTGTIREEDSLLKYYYVDDEQFISYEYDGAIPESENTLAGVVSEQTVSGRLEPGMPYLFMIRASDEWGFPEDNMVESEQVVVYMLDVDVQGKGTVTSEPKGIECVTKCSEDFISKEGVTLTAIPDEGAVFNGWTGSEKCYGTGVCTLLTLAQNESVTATFTAIDSCLNGETDCSVLNDECNIGECDEITGDCIKVPANEGVGCDDGQYCTEGETCQSGVCTGGGDPCPDGTTCIESLDTCEDNCTDNDGDTYALEGGICGDVDCDDENREVNPGAAEVCNGIDDNCVNGIDETGGALCDNGSFCDGQETCGGNLGCLSGSLPCPDGTTCNESTKSCEDDCTDNDGDTYAIEGGSCGAVDCDDVNRDVHPGAAETCDGKDNNCDDVTDEGCQCVNGETQACGTDTGECQIGKQTCAGGQWGECIGEIRPSNEICDGKDNNCDGDADEGCDCIDGSTRTCGTDTGECSTGKETCENGKWGECTGEVDPATETCDGKDNDCDGDTDEGCDCIDGATRTCGTNTGECSTGTETCENGKWGECSGEVAPATETCDGKDNDCDGDTDEGCDCIDGSTRTCGTDTGECSTGKETCENGKWGECSGEVAPATETCDGKDNDCDGDTDEGCDCIDGSTRTCGTNIGECSTGKETCENGKWGECLGEIGPATETCDGKDNDCDGMTDENLNCKPDLIIQGIKQNGAAHNNGDTITVPIIVVVKNNGGAATVNFKTSTSFTTKSSGPYVVSFTVKGQKDTWYPWTSLAGGSSVTFDGFLTFNYWYEGNEVFIRALADSCSGDEFISNPPCRVDESNEKNNESSSISVNLPYYFYSPF